MVWCHHIDYFGIIAVYQQMKQQKEQPTPRLLYVSTILFYLSIIRFGLSLPISLAVFVMVYMEIIFFG